MCDATSKIAVEQIELLLGCELSFYFHATSIYNVYFWYVDITAVLSIYFLTEYTLLILLQTINEMICHRAFTCYNMHNSYICKMLHLMRCRRFLVEHTTR